MISLPLKGDPSGESPRLFAFSPAVSKTGVREYFPFLHRMEIDTRFRLWYWGVRRSSTLWDLGELYANVRRLGFFFVTRTSARLPL